MTNLTDLWAGLADAHRTAKTLRALFADNPNRFAEFSESFDDLLLDYSKTTLDTGIRAQLLGLATAARVAQKRDAMFAGEKINNTEDRAVLHTALRNPPGAHVLVDGEDVMPEITKTLAALNNFAEGIRSGAIAASDGAPFTDVINIGIGGSDLGPVMVTGALAPYHNGPRVHFVSNVDAAHLADTIRTLDPAR
ncbi:MAG TPA: glucose-6-phosphate isomerase, partial [Acidocella sp.]|nr:glucose-6-phosphate isomerase [Acidocella sp.]